MNKFSQDLTEAIKLKLEKDLINIKNMQKITGKKIDRRFDLDLNELTISELDFEMSKRAASIKEQLDPRIYTNRNAGGNKILKILLFIPFFFKLVFKGSIRIMKDFFFFNNALLIRMRKNDDKIEELEEKISAIEDSIGSEKQILS